MQKTFLARQLKRAQGAIDKRSMSVDVKSPSQILQFIKLKRYNIGKTNTSLQSEINEVSWKPVRLVLPKIYPVNNTNIQFQNSFQKWSESSDIVQQPLIIPKYSSHNKMTLPSVQINEQQEQQNQKVQLQRCTFIVHSIVSQLPKISRCKNLQNLLPLVQFLTQYNPFFKNLAMTLIVSFLKVCKIREIPKGRWIYKKTFSLTSFFIILWGKVKIINVEKNFKKVSLKGQTLSQQILFNQFTQNSIREEGAKSLTHCFLLEISYDTYLKIYKQLVLKGYKTQFLTMQTLIKRNYILKQGLKYQKSQR